ncbi:ATPase [Alicyclobacillus cellulosilyticus]|uniref:ATPase n=1 Tax=Alicyclobacillus cellulosilyticus TaxID=1003997 RepID=A0A917K0Y0_9BACL|nr:MoxR family ATPase [Alicyclobacillus cellulosilyticus]GGI95373.1 ATPase [Alicyclobacillus cellulosilyticus]
MAERDFDTHAGRAGQDPETAAALRAAAALAGRIRAHVARVVVGKEDVVDLLLAALFAGGHVLLEDVPGTGKTLLAKTLAKSIAGTFRRIQFTPDLLPSDLTGIYYFNQKRADFEFRPGPVFTHILLADELNRATPRTQSSLLECMEERQVTVDGVTHPLATPFLVLATQNPVETQGTFPLPEAQLDRFLLRVSMGYPSHEEGLAILRRFQADDPLAAMDAVASLEEVAAAQAAVRHVHVADDVLDYLLTIVEHTRTHPGVALGVSPRGSQALLRAAQAYAVIQGRDYVLPDDVKRLAQPVLAHRLLLGTALPGVRAADVVAQVVAAVPVPAEPAWAERRR